ncbi:hypothetical protein GHK86_20830 [Acidimicrobiaceae bacterium USS-CC1]|uniref:Twin-arginine translocation signal domain-containing protein n=1 Tax=Acidiferrimicrobium australe TaxID=2664430 RepID=A0ABW9QZR5_9ACTN|nr:hypothetical protein [Acidiferrimicrobium australe]
MSLTDRLAGALERRVSRRSFLVRSTFAGSALAAGRARWLVEPRSAYHELCNSVYCGSSACSCSSTCCAGYTEFCCTLDGGYNSCPPGTVMGGWWLAEGSVYCDGPRYYMDCNAVCHCSAGCGSFCDPGCDGLSCGCAEGSCDHYLTGCFQFRYGQCNQDVGCIGRIHCRVVTCVPPWEIDPSCTRTLATDDFTADQDAACLGPDPTYPPPPFAFRLEEVMFIAKDSESATQWFVSGNTKVPIHSAADLQVYRRVLEKAGLDDTTHILTAGQLKLIPTAVPAAGAAPVA